ncbi:MAG: superoxide dismutase [Elusimicrobia bacterium]|nr:superoxide dismutase [Elusimicrobiota bacterium]
MAYEPKKYPLEGKCEGLSDNQIQQHRDILYVGYVNKLNEITTGLEKADRSKANATYSEFGELKREETFALNGTVLHEFYFENLGGKGSRPGKETTTLLNRDFGSYEKWLEDFKACGICARGWAVLCFNFYDNKLHNYVMDTHHFHVPFFVWPLLVLDVYEHAYTIDYGVKRAPYLETFFKNINWNVVEQRLVTARKLELVRT